MTTATGGARPATVAGAPVRRHAGRRRVVAVVGVLLLLALVLTGWLAVRAYQAGTALQAVADGAQRIRADVTSGDLSDLNDRDGPVQALQRDAARAAAATADPVWRLAEVLPVVGVDAAAVRTVATAVDALASDGVPPLLEVAALADPATLRLVDGRIDLAPLVSAAPALRTAADATARARDAVGGLDPDRLHGPLPGAVVELGTQLDEGASMLGSLARVAGVLPPMLGSDGPRTYLALFLNSGELRTQGGIPGAIAVVTATGGRIQLAAQESSSNLRALPEPVLPLTPDELTVASDRLGRQLQNTVLLPDAPRSGQLAAALWQAHTGQQVDGVVAVDTVALAYLLRAIGDVELPDGPPLTPDTLVEQLLLDAYRRYPDPDDSDAFFARVAAAVFERVSSGGADPGVLVDALRTAAGERRLTLWSAHPEEQSLIIGSAVDGALLSGGHDGAVGIFLDNSTGWKTDTFLATDVTPVSASCRAGRATLGLRLDLRSDVPADVGSLPFYVVGDGSTGVPPGVIRQRVSIYSPVGGEVERVVHDGAPVGGVPATLGGRDVEVLTATLEPGASASFTVTVSGPADGPGIDLWTTPTSDRPGLRTLASPCA